MIKLNLLIVSILVIAAANAQLPNYVPTNGLIGFWPFTGNANDASGNGHNGIVSGAVLDADRNGVANASYKLNNSFIEMLNIANINLQNDFSFSYWQKLNSYNSMNCILDLNQSQACSTGPVMFQFNDSIILGKCGNNTNAAFLDSKNTVLNNWVNYTFTSSAGQIIIYKNGAFLKSTNLNWVATNSVQFTLGNAGNTGAVLHTQPSNIYLDDVGFWSRKLSTEEITVLYNSPTKINESYKNSLFQINYNPIQKVLKIEYPTKAIGSCYKIYSIDGQLLAKGIIAKGQVDIEFEKQNQGLFIINIENYGSYKF